MTDAMSESAAYGDERRTVLPVPMSECSMCGSSTLLPDGQTCINCVRLKKDPRSGEDRRAPAVEEQDAVNHPKHYGKGKDDPYEVIKVLRAWGCFDNALRFNSLKYLARAGKKGDVVEDLKKAAWYVQAEIEDIERYRREKEKKT